jgi:hypothetical protein
VTAFAPTLQKCEQELRSTAEDWLLVGLKLGHRISVISVIDLNKVPLHEPADTL